MRRPEIAGRGQAANQDEIGLAALGANAGWSGVAPGGGDGLGRFHGQRVFPVEQQHPAHPAGQLALRWVPEAVVSDLVEPLGQNVLAEAAQEFRTGQGAGAPLASTAITLLVLEGDRLLVEGGDPAVGNGGAENVSCQVIEHGLFTFTPRRAVDDPRFTPCFGRTTTPGSLLAMAARILPRTSLASALTGTRKSVRTVGCQ